MFTKLCVPLVARFFLAVKLRFQLSFLTCAFCIYFSCVIEKLGNHKVYAHVVLYIPFFFTKLGTGYVKLQNGFFLNNSFNAFLK